jgi:hypothetical protein
MLADQAWGALMLRGLHRNPPKCLTLASCTSNLSVQTVGNWLPIAVAGCCEPKR